MRDYKHRVFLALYRQPNIKSSLRSQLGISFYHWAIWIEPKGAKDETSAYCFDTVVEDYSGCWQFRCDDSAQAIRSTDLLLRVMVGKLPPGAKLSSGVFDLLHCIPPPSQEVDSAEDSASWVAEALLVLQENGMAEDFNIPDIMHNSALIADGLLRDVPAIGGRKINAVSNRKFP